MLPKISDYEINFDCETISSEFLKVSQRLTPEKSINNFNIGENEYRVQETISYLLELSMVNEWPTIFHNFRKVYFEMV